MAIVTVKLERTNFRTRRLCLFCGGSSEKDTVNAEMFSAVVDVRPGQTTAERPSYVVCHRCLGNDNIAALIRENAAWHRERAAELLEAIADDLPQLPSPVDWEAANAAADLM